MHHPIRPLTFHDHATGFRRAQPYRRAACSSHLGRDGTAPSIADELTSLATNSIVTRPKTIWDNDSGQSVERLLKDSSRE